ncbi:decapping endonuclease targeting mRNA [Neophaeococcomyces mojaviensis]|uniref:Decapping endonuclease targeting mRNA n=1 Tax=Neophaeococcomyces mojaviensis TaxID=3383035 RepID=A0ACC2ZV28_9EURO|nr:decapping endonuclease targeting mRNA [Knufia sp. JES_112]
MSQSQAFNIHPIGQFAKADIAVRRPREIAYFSYDEDHRYRQNDSSLRYYYPPNIPADLSKGFDTFRQLDDSADDHLDGLLQALIHHESEKRAKLETDFITWRGMMTKIMVVPFSNLDSWEMNATRFQDTIFIEENHGKKLASREAQYSTGAVRGAMSQDLMSYWGYKFESISLLEKHWCYSERAEIEGREDAQVSNYAQYCSIVRTGFGKSKMVIGGEVDAVQDIKPLEQGAPINWVELKTSAELVNEKEVNKYERKLMKFWAQSFLLGVPKIIVGFRDQQGWVHRLEELDTQSIPDKILRSERKVWDGQTCINFTSAFLDWLKETITTEGVWRIRKREKSPVLEVFKIEESGMGNILSDAFVEWRNDTLPRILTAQKSEGITHVDGRGQSVQNGDPP